LVLRVLRDFGKWNVLSLKKNAKGVGGSVSGLQ